MRSARFIFITVTSVISLCSACDSETSGLPGDQGGGHKDTGQGIIDAQTTLDSPGPVDLPGTADAPGVDQTTPLDTGTAGDLDMAAADMAAPDAAAAILDVGAHDAPLPDIVDASTDAVMCNGVDCNDSLSCTDDKCSDGGCINPVKPGACQISGACYKPGDVKSAGSCHACNPLVSSSAWADDVNLCPASTLSCMKASCSGGVCTQQLLPGNCLIGGKCYSAGASASGTACAVCDPTKSTSAWSPLADGASCTADAYSCTTDVCKGGKCTHPIKKGYCLVSGKCYGNGSPSSPGACTGCLTGVSTTSFSPLTNGTSCTADAYTCTTDVCKSGKCTHPIKNGYCLVSGKCYGNGSPSSPGACTGCLTGVSTTSFSPLANGTSCTADAYKCTTDVCKSGTCTHPIKNGYCLIGSKCYGNGSPSSPGACTGCLTNVSNTSWSPLANGTSCTADAYSCTTDMCKSGKCTHPIKNGYCLISGKCYGNGSPSSPGACTGCLTNVSNTSWSPLANGTSCTADAYSCTTDMCKGGKCSHPIKNGWCLISGKCVPKGQPGC